MQVSATMAPTVVGQTVGVTEVAAQSSSLIIRTLSAAGTALSFLATVLERCCAFGAGALVGYAVTTNKPEDSLKIAVVAIMAFTSLNVVKLVVFGPSSFIYGVFSDTMLGGVGLGTGFVAGLLKNC